MTVATGLPLAMGRADIAGVQLAHWATKGEALTALAGQRARGLNVDVIEAHRVWLPLTLVWMLARPDHHEGATYLMTDDGAWLRGRLVDQGPCCGGHPGRDCSWDRHPVSWTLLADEVFPASFTHVTRTVPDGANQRERYKTKSNGSCGRFVRSDDSVALCTCGWRRHAATRDEARAAARYHREHPEENAATLDAA
jgi:hypothetical protein